MRIAARTIVTGLVAVALLGPAAVGVRAQAAKAPALPLRLTAFAVNMSNIGTGSSGIVEIRLTNLLA